MPAFHHGAVIQCVFSNPARYWLWIGTGILSTYLQRGPRFHHIAFPRRIVMHFGLAGNAVAGALRLHFLAAPFPRNWSAVEVRYRAPCPQARFPAFLVPSVDHRSGTFRCSEGSADLVNDDQFSLSTANSPSDIPRIQKVLLVSSRIVPSRLKCTVLMPPASPLFQVPS